MSAHGEIEFFFLNKKDVEPVVSDNVHLTIFHPDSHIDDGLKINAEIVWVNPDYSSDHHKVGLKFLEINEEQVSYINRMIKWLSTEGHYFFHCDLEKR